MNQPATSTAMTVAPAPASATGFGLIMSPTTLAETRAFCEMLAKTEFVPKAFRLKPDSIMVVGAMGSRLGVDVFSAMAGIADINGRPSVYGDLMLAVCLMHPLFEDCIETFAGKPYDDNYTATCVAKRKGREPVTRSFSVIEAKEAQLWKKAGPWTNTPQRMLQMRARSFALRDTFADRLAGFHSREEMEDVIDVSDSVTVHSEPKAAKKRIVEAKAESVAAAPEPTTKPVDAFDVEPVKSVGEHLAEAQATEPTPPRNTSVDACVKEYSKLWNHSDAARDEAKKIREAWKLKQIADLAGAGPDDREAFLIEVETAMKRDGK